MTDIKPQNDPSTPQTIYAQARQKLLDQLGLIAGPSAPGHGDRIADAIVNAIEDMIDAAIDGLFAPTDDEAKGDKTKNDQTK